MSPRSNGFPNEQVELHHRVRALMIFRLIVMTGLLVIGILILDKGDFPYALGPIYGIIIAGYVLTLIYWILLELRISYFWLLYTQLFIDAVLQTGLVHFSGGITSQYIILYPLIILAGSIFYQVSGGLIICTWSSILFSLAIWLEYTGRLPQVIRDEEARYISGSMVFLRVYLHICFFYLIAFLGGFLSERAERKRREALQATTELQRVRLNTDDILRNMSSGLITIDEQGRLVSFNRAAARILGCPYEENYTGRDCMELFDRHLREFGTRLIRVLHEGILHDSYELMILPPGASTYRPIGVKTTLLTETDGQKRGVIALFEDLTDQKRLEERIRRSDRLAAVGRLSAGIAHEIRNPLASISGAVQMLKDELKLEDDNLRLLNLVVRESDRLNGIIGNFLYFSRLETATEMHDIHLQRLMDDLFFLIKNRPDVVEHEHELEYEINIDADLIVYGNLDQLEQLFLNLCLNALQAMDYAGQIRITAYQDDLEWVVIHFSDTGKGIAPDQMDKIFDPFYTNRRGGTGLGLAIVSRIIENHRGEIRVESTPHRGTTFVLRLPSTPPTTIGRPQHSVSSSASTVPTPTSPV